ncbi:MAG: flagellar protein FlaG [Gammaproteobacteria bacterium]|nr:flagellar protein FlaG [Gammaproteobacteria bacterium]
MANEIKLQQAVLLKTPQASSSTTAANHQPSVNMDAKPVVQDTMVKSNPTDAQDKQKQAAVLEESVARMADYARSQKLNLEFSIEEVTGQTLVKVIDQETDTVIRQIPSEEAVALAKRLKDSQGGIFQEIA